MGALQPKITDQKICRAAVSFRKTSDDDSHPEPSAKNDSRPVQHLPPKFVQKGYKLIPPSLHRNMDITIIPSFNEVMDIIMDDSDDLFFGPFEPAPKNFLLKSSLPSFPIRQEYCSYIPQLRQAGQCNFIMPTEWIAYCGIKWQQKKYQKGLELMNALTKTFSDNSQVLFTIWEFLASDEKRTISFFHQRTFAQALDDFADVELGPCVTDAMGESMMNLFAQLYGESASRRMRHLAVNSFLQTQGGQLFLHPHVDVGEYYKKQVASMLFWMRTNFDYFFDLFSAGKLLHFTGGQVTLSLEKNGGFAVRSFPIWVLFALQLMPKKGWICKETSSKWLKNFSRDFPVELDLSSLQLNWLPPAAERSEQPPLFPFKNVAGTYVAQNAMPAPNFGAFVRPFREPFKIRAPQEDEIRWTPSMLNGLGLLNDLRQADAFLN